MKLLYFTIILPDTPHSQYSNSDCCSKTEGLTRGLIAWNRELQPLTLLWATKDQKGVVPTVGNHKIIEGFL